MAWTVNRNSIVASGGTYDERGRRKLVGVKDALVGDGWTLRGTGDGVSNYSMAGVDYCTNWATMGSGAWVWLENLDGAEIVLWLNGTQKATLRASQLIGYSASSGESATTAPGSTTPPADEMNLPSTTYTYWGGYQPNTSTIILDGGYSFMIFGRFLSNTYSASATAFVKLSDTQPGDTEPYWMARFDYGSSGNYELYHFFEGWDYQAARHPVNGTQRYGAIELQFPGNPMIDLPDNLAGDPFMHEIWIGCGTSGSYHVKGKLPGVYRVAGNKVSAVKLYDNKFIVCDDVAFPWNSTDNMTVT